MPRHVARELDHAAIRGLKAEALHLHLDLRRPEVQRTVGVGAPGTAADAARAGARLPRATGRFPAELDREEFVRLGEELMDSVERDLAGA